MYDKSGLRRDLHFSNNSMDFCIFHGILQINLSFIHTNDANYKITQKCTSKPQIDSITFRLIDKNKILWDWTTEKLLRLSRRSSWRSVKNVMWWLNNQKLNNKAITICTYFARSSRGRDRLRHMQYAPIENKCYFL